MSQEKQPQNSSDALKQETEKLAILNKLPRRQRWRGYLSLSGPGWMQSAMTIGGASAMSSLFAGAFLEYRLLWVQPVAIILGIVMLYALSYQTIQTGMRPFEAMKTYVHPGLAWAWAIATLVSTLIWHFPMYALAGGMTEDIIKAVFGVTFTSTQETILLLTIGVGIWGIATTFVINYNKGHKGVKRFETILKIMIWLIISSFLFVILIQSFTKGIEWMKVFKGFFSFYLPTDKRGVTLMMATYSATVGINMTFLFGYSYLKRGWGKEHIGLAKFDLITGMFIPFVIATSLMVIATGATIYDPAKFADGSVSLSPMEAASMLEESGIPMVFSRIIFGFGIIAMAVNAITLHMLTCGFAICEMFGIPPKGKKYILACLIPTPGVLGVVLWQTMGAWIAIPTSAIAGVMLPIAYVGFFALNNSKKFLGENKPTGMRAILWNSAMLVSIGASIAGATYFIYTIMQ